MFGLVDSTCVRLWIIDTWEQALSISILTIMVLLITRISILIDRAHVRHYHLDTISTKKIAERDFIIEEQAKQIQLLKSEKSTLTRTLEETNGLLRGVRRMIDGGIK